MYSHLKLLCVQGVDPKAVIAGGIAVIAATSASGSVLGRFTEVNLNCE